MSKQFWKNIALSLITILLICFFFTSTSIGANISKTNYSITNDHQVPDEYLLAQVTAASQLRDMDPTDWSYESLRNLVERWACITGFPDRNTRLAFESRWKNARQQTSNRCPNNIADLALRLIDQDRKAGNADLIFFRAGIV